MLSEHILNEKLLAVSNNDNWFNETLEDSDNGNEIAENESGNDMILEEDENNNREEGVIGRFKDMIIEGLGNEHWDKDERVCLIADKEHLEFFAERTVEDVIINNDLKFNLQKAINKSGLLFHIKLEKKTSLLSEPINLPIQKLMYLCEKKKN